MAHSDRSAGERPAFRRFAGKTVLAHQIQCAAHLNCERVICLAGSAGPDLGSARSYAERAGIRFEVVDALVRIAGNVTASDEVIVFADGILPDCAALLAPLDARPAVLAFPADPALERGFERIDAERAWSGALRMRGDGVSRLADLPADCDLSSSLLRIALQSGVPVVELDPAPIADHTWQKRVDRRASEEHEQRWIARQVRPAPFAAPGQAVIERMAMRWARDAGGGRWARAPHLAALGTGLLALLAGLTGWPAWGLALLWLTSCSLAAAGIFDRVDALGAPARKSGRLLAAAGWLQDGLLAGLLALLIAAEPSWLRVFLPLMLLASLRLGQATARQPWQAVFGDRILQIGVLALGAWQGWTSEVAAVGASAALAAQLWTSLTSRAKLTAD